MKILTENRIKELIELSEKKIIQIYKEHNDVPDMSHYQYIFDSIKNVNDMTKENIKKELYYYSHSSNYWGGVIPMLTAYEERLGH